MICIYTYLYTQGPGGMGVPPEMMQQMMRDGIDPMQFMQFMQTQGMPPGVKPQGPPGGGTGFPNQNRGNVAHGVPGPGGPGPGPGGQWHGDGGGGRGRGGGDRGNRGGGGRGGGRGGGGRGDGGGGGGHVKPENNNNINNIINNNNNINNINNTNNNNNNSNGPNPEHMSGQKRPLSDISNEQQELVLGTLLANETAEIDIKEDFFFAGPYKQERKLLFDVECLIEEDEMKEELTVGDRTGKPHMCPW